MRRLEHPLKREIQAVREIILGASPKIAERVKWNAPSFYLRDDPTKDLAAVHLRATDCVHLVFVFHGGAMIQDRRGLLEGVYKDRRMARLRDLADVKARRQALEQVVTEWVRLTAR